MDWYASQESLPLRALFYTLGLKHSPDQAGVRTVTEYSRPVCGCVRSGTKPHVQPARRKSKGGAPVPAQMWAASSAADAAGVSQSGRGADAAESGALRTCSKLATTPTSPSVSGIRPAHAPAPPSPPTNLPRLASRCVLPEYPSGMGGRSACVAREYSRTGPVLPAGC
jgi:hypothetical protein